MKRFFPLVLALVFSLAAGSALALPKQGDFDLSGGVAFNMMRDADDTVDLTARVGVMFTGDLGFGLSGSVNVKGDDDIYTTFVDARWHFNVDPQLQPYAGVKVGTAYIDYDKADSETFLGIGGFGGARFYFNPRIAAFGEIGHTFFFGSETEAATGINFGASFLF